MSGRNGEDNHELTDVELVKKYLAGEEAALEKLIRRYFKQIFFFAKTFVKTDVEAEDITQEVFVKLWKNLKKFDQGKKFKTWLFQITKNTCIDFLRKSKNFAATDQVSEEQMAAEMESLTDNSPLPEELFDSRGFSQSLENIIHNLPVNSRLTVSLHLQQDLTFEEISQITGEPLNTVKSRYRRALLEIRKNAPKKP